MVKASEVDLGELISRVGKWWTLPTLLLLFPY